MTQFHHDPFACPRCAYVMDASTDLEDVPPPGGPEPGTISLCLRCGAILVLVTAPPLSRSRLAARLAGPDELAKLPPHRRHRLEQAVAWVHAMRGQPPA